MITRIVLSDTNLYIDYKQDERIVKVGYGIDCFFNNPKGTEVYIGETSHFWTYHSSTRMLIIDEGETHPFYISLSPSNLPDPGLPKTLWIVEDEYKPQSVPSSETIDIPQILNSKQSISEDVTFYKGSPSVTNQRDWVKERDDLAKEIYVSCFQSGKILTISDSSSTHEHFIEKSFNLATMMIEKLKFEENK